MNDRELLPKNPIGAPVLLNILIIVIVLATAGVGYVGLMNKNRGKVKETKKLEVAITRLESEIGLLEMDLEKAQDIGRLGALHAKLQAEHGLELRLILDDAVKSEVVYLPNPTAVQP